MHLVREGKSGEDSNNDSTEGSVGDAGAALSIATAAVAVAVGVAAAAVRGAGRVVAGVLALGHAVAEIGVGRAGRRAPLGARAIKARCLTSTVLDELLSLLRDFRKVVGVERPVLALGWAVEVGDFVG